MGPWTQFDEDDYRLPEGMKRIGYDADEGRYYFRDSDGSIWRGPEGAEFGELSKVSEAPTSVANQESENNDVEALPRHSRRQGGYQLLTEDPNVPMAHSQYPEHGSPYRALFPFFLIIAVVLLLIWRLIVSPAMFPGPSQCPPQTGLYYVQPGEFCWGIAKMHNCSLERLQELNPKVQCENLMPGTSLCLPPLKSPFSSSTLTAH